MASNKTRTRFDDPAIGLIPIGVIGEGANGLTWLMKQGEVFAVLKVAKANDEYSRQSFTNEAIAIKEYGNNTSIFVWSYFGDDGLQSDEYPWILMDYIPGVSLHELLENIREDENGQQREFHPLVKYQIIFGIAQGLNLLHKAGIRHRDVKPGNIFIDQDFRPHLGDFGDVSGNTVTVNVHGTTHFLPPEAYQDTPGAQIQCDCPYDVYEFGSTLFQILTFEWPFNYLTDGSQPLADHTAKGELDLRFEDPTTHEFTLNPVDQPLYQIIKMCWAFDPGQRPTMEMLAYWIYQGAQTILTGDDLNEFNNYALLISGEKIQCGKEENVRKAINAGFGVINQTLEKVEGILGFSSTAQGFQATKMRSSVPSNRPNTRPK